MDAVEKLTETFKKFPGVGPRQARRFVYFLLTQPKGMRDELARHFAALDNEVAQCESCLKFFRAQGEGLKCSICADEKRDGTALLIVEKDVDLENIEKTRSFAGRYFVLGGALPLMEENPAEKIRARELFDIVQKRAKEGALKEVILALSANPEGENTAQYLQKILGPLKEKYGLKVSTLGRGLSTGTELEYSDADTLFHALKNRHEK